MTQPGLRLRLLLNVLASAAAVGALVHGRGPVIAASTSLDSTPPGSHPYLVAVGIAPPRGMTGQPVKVFQDEARELAAEKLRSAAFVVEPVGLKLSWIKVTVGDPGPYAALDNDAGVPVWILDYRGVFKAGPLCYDKARVHVNATTGTSTLASTLGERVPCPPGSPPETMS